MVDRDIQKLRVEVGGLVFMCICACRRASFCMDATPWPTQPRSTIPRRTVFLFAPPVQRKRRLSTMKHQNKLKKSLPIVSVVESAKVNNPNPSNPNPYSSEISATASIASNQGKPSCTWFVRHERKARGRQTIKNAYSTSQRHITEIRVFVRQQRLHPAVNPPASPYEVQQDVADQQLKSAHRDKGHTE